MTKCREINRNVHKSSPEINFQEYTMLLPHRTVFGDVKLALDFRFTQNVRRFTRLDLCRKPLQQFKKLQ